MTAPHDIIGSHDLSHGAVSLDCACGRSIVGTSREKAQIAHLAHRGLEQSRASLEGVERDD